MSVFFADFKKNSLHLHCQKLLKIFQMKGNFKILTFSAVLLILSACTIPVATVAKHGEWYDGKQVKVKGKVVNTLHLEDLNFFVIKKGGNYLNVKTNDFLPAINDNVKVKGKVINKFYYQRDTILIIEETVKPSKTTNFNKAVN